MKKLLTFLTMALLFYGVGWAAESVYYTLDGTISGGTNGYLTESEITQGSVSWIVTGNTVQSPWRIGGKSANNGVRTIYSTSPMGSAISKVSLTIGSTSGEIDVSSLKLTVYSDVTMTSVIDEVTGAFDFNSTIDFTPSHGDNWTSGAYYKFSFTVNSTSSSSNKYFEFKKAEFYTSEEGGGTNPDPPITSERMTFVQTSTSAGTLTNAPSGVTATFSNTFNNNKEQITKNNTMTLTISGMSSRYKITGVTLNVHNNASSGNGDADVTMDGVSIGSMSITGLGNTYSEQDVTITECPFTGDLVITLTCTTNSVYCNAFYIDYEEIPAKTYDVTVTQATGGTITASPVGEDVVDAGDEVTVSYTLDEGYEFGSWSITGATGPDANGKLTVTGDVTITATFNKVNYTLTRSSNSLSMGDVKITDASGNELGTQPTTAQMGDVVYFKLKTEYGYQPTSDPVTVTNTTANTTITPEGPTNGVYHFTMPAGNVTIAATFQAYHGTLRLAGRFNGNTGWRTGTSGPAFTYDSANDKYTIDAYFTGEGDGNYFFITYDGNASYPSADGNWVVTNTTGTPVALTWDGNGHNFYIDNGVYTIELPGDLSTIAFTKKTPTITFNPASGSEVEQGTSVSATSTLTDLVSAIQDENKGGTVTVTCNPATLNTIGSNQTVTATATIGNYSESATATYTVVAVNNSNQFELVTDLSTQLIAGKKYIIVSENNNSAYSGNGDSATEITISNHTTTVDPTDVAYLTLGGSTGAWTFNFTRNGSVYNVYHTSTTAVKDNSFGASTTATPSEFSISLNSGAFDISADGKHLRANSATDFRFYDANSSGSAIQLYRQMVEEVKDYTIDYAVVTGGSATGAASANEGEEITVTVTAESGYACTGISVSPAAEVTDNGDGTYTFTMPASNVTVTPTFASAYAITYVATPAAGGTVTGVANAAEGSTVVINVTANDDYQIESVKYSWGSQQSSVDVPFVNGNYQITMPGSATTVTATFVKIPHGISVVSSHGDVTGLPATATSGTSVTFTVTPNAGYVVSSVSGTFNNGSGSLNITDNGNGTYTFNMPASDVAITVTYFASEDYELLTDLADINAEDTYLIVGGAVSALGTYDKVMGKSTGSGIMGTVDLTSSNYDSTTGIITSTADMAVVNFLVDDGTYAIHTADGYVNESSVTASTPFYWTIDLDATSSRVQITSTNKHFSYNSSSPRWKAYDSEQGASYIFKLANKNKVKRPTITGAAGEFLGQYNFIGKDNVTMACATDGATIEYSLDGGTTWLNYSEAVEIVTNAAGNTVVVQARATKTGMDPSEVVTATFTCIKPTAPTFGSNGPDAYVNPVFVYPKSALNDRRAYGEENVSFAYTTTGTVADATSPAVTTKNSNGYYILLDDNATLSVVTMINGIASDASGGAYTFSVDAPTFSLAGGNYDGNQQTRLSTETKTQQNNLSWNTVIYYTTGNTEFAFDATTGQVTSEGWVAYDATNDPYLDILVQDSPVTIKAVTLSNYFNGQSEYRASEVTSETYVLTAANLAVTISPAAGTYVNAQNVTLGVKNEIGEYTIYYTTDGSDPSGNSGIEYTEPITVDHDMTIKVYAMDSRTGDGGEATAEAAYKIGIQPVVYSPFPGTIYKGDDEDINVEMFSVTPNAKVYYTVAEGEGNWPTDPTTASTLYSAPVPLETGKVYNFKAIAVIGSMVSTVTPGTFTIQAKGSGWLNVKEMANSSQGTSKTLENPVQIIYMSKYRNGDTSVPYPGEPEYCFVRDNSGYGLIYFGAGNIAAYKDYEVFEMGDWIAGGEISGAMSNWNSSFINELGGGSSTNYRVTSWPSETLGNTDILPEETTNLAITQGWTYQGAFTPSQDDGYDDHIDHDKNLFGHYVHMRKNTINNVTGDGNGNGKHAGIITDQSGVPLNYYDGFYLFSGYNGSPDYDQTFFDNIQNKGGTFDVYAIVQFYGPNASNSSYSNAPYEIFPIDFEWIFKPEFNIESGEYDEPQTVSLTCETEGAQIWYKTSEMDDYVLYTEPFTVSTTTTIDAYSTIVTKYNDVMESVIETINVRFATHVSPPFITPDGGVYAVTDRAIDVTIIRYPELDDASVMQSDVTIWFTVDGSDPADENNPNRYEYTTENKEEHLDEIHTTTTVRAISEYHGMYSAEAISQTYTFVESNGIIYDLVTSVDQINEKGIYVIVAQPYHEAMSNVQGATTRGTTGVKFVDEDMKTKVYGNQDVAVFTVTPLTHEGDTGGEKHFLFTTHNGATLVSNGILYVDETAATNGNTLLTEAEEDAMGNSVAVVTIDNDEGEQSHKARIRFNYAGGDNRYLQYWNRDHYFTTYKTQDDERAVYLYYKEATPLATIEKEGVKNKQYTVADRLLVVAANNTEHVIWAKDEGNVSIAKTEIKNGQIDYMRFVAEHDINNKEGATVKFQNGEWDQSNWVMIKLHSSDAHYSKASDYEGHYIDPASFTGTYTDNVNYTMEAMADLNVDLTKGGDFTPNVYCAANFLDANLNLTAESQGAPELPDGDRHFFFVNPKVQEVATITYAVWDGTKFVMPARNDAGTINGAGLTGAFEVGWTYNGSTPTLETGVAYQFTAVLNKVAQQGNAPRRAESTVTPQQQAADGTKVVYPLDLTADENHIVTEVRDLTGNAVREVASVKYVSITGVVSDKPFEGMNIIVTRYTDGTTSTAKVMR